MFACKQFSAFDKHTVGPDRVIHRDLVALANHIVILTVSGSGMYCAGTRLGRHVVAKDYRYFLRQKSSEERPMI